MHIVRAICLLCCGIACAPADQAPQKCLQFPCPEKLSYRVEWRLVTAGLVSVQMSRAGADGWNVNLDVLSAGLVNRLYRVQDKYRVVTTQNFCGVNSDLDAQEGKRHKVQVMKFDAAQHKLDYEERDLLKNTQQKKSLDVPPCTYEIAGALASLRVRDLQPGKWTTLALTDGNKLAYGKVQAQARESVTAGGKSYQTIRCEAFLFDNVLYRRKGRLFIWFSDDISHVPVQMRFQLGFPIGTVSVELEKREPL
jgi:Protein of unknown function (DUF3108)